MNSNIKNITLAVGGLVIVLGGIALFSHTEPVAKNTKLDAFVMCVKDKGAKFFGAFWCPHCQAQKALFGDSVELLPYTECSTPDGKAQLQICIDKKIEGYPTWEFKDGSRLSGETSLETLATKTGCELPK